MNEGDFYEDDLGAIIMICSCEGRTKWLSVCMQTGLVIHLPQSQYELERKLYKSTFVGRGNKSQAAIRMIQDREPSPL